MEGADREWPNTDEKDIAGLVHRKLAAQHSRVSEVPVPFLATNGELGSLIAKDAFAAIVDELNDRIEKVV